MALRKLPQIAKQASSCLQFQRQLHVTGAKCGFFDFLNKPMPRQEDMVTGYQKIVMDAEKVGENPLAWEHTDESKQLLGGTGTRADPFLVPSRNTRRLVMIEHPASHGGPFQCFWVTLENGGRCPVTAQYYKLVQDTTDKWGIDELDLFKH